MSIRYISTKVFSSIVSFLSVLVPTPCQQSYFSHNHSFSRPCNGQILVSVFLNFLFACVGRMPAPVLNGTLWLQTSSVFGLALVERRPHYLIPGVCSGRGVSAFSQDTPSLRTETEMRRMKQKLVLLSGSSCLEALGANPSSPRDTPGSEVNDPTDPVPDSSMPQQS